MTADASSARSPLISPEALADRVAAGDPSLRLVDVRWYLGQPAGTGRAAYEAGHIPGALFLDVDSDLVAPVGPGRHPLPDPTAFCRTLEAAGIGDRTTVVAYDDVGGWVAARFWWMLEDLGFDGDVAVLDGGYPAWLAAGLPVERARPSLPPGRLTLRAGWSRTVDREALKPRLGTVLLLDARGGPRYRGEVEPIDPIAGHIPTALSAPTDGNLGPDGRFLPADALRARYLGLRDAALAVGAARPGAAGEDPEVVVSCGSGVSACHDALAMRIAGLPDPLLYPGSYSDWSRSGEAVATGPEPGAFVEPGRPGS